MWATAVVSPTSAWDRRLPLDAYMGLFGTIGLTAYFGLFDIGQPKAGETLVVSARLAQSAPVVGQIGKLLGMRVVGIGGHAENAATSPKHSVLMEPLTTKWGRSTKSPERTLPHRHRCLLRECRRQNIGNRLKSHQFAGANRPVWPHRPIQCHGPHAGPYNLGGNLSCAGRGWKGLSSSTITPVRPRLCLFWAIGMLRRNRNTAPILSRGWKTAPTAVNKLTGENNGKLIVQVSPPSPKEVKSKK